MPIKIPEKMPAYSVLSDENIFVMTEQRADRQDIRPLKIIILNLMPDKITSENQLLRLVSNTPLQVDVTFLQAITHQSKNTSESHLKHFYQDFKSVRSQKFDGMIITGAPVEQIPYEDVDYWEEITKIFAWSKQNVFSTLYICWGALAGLYYHFGIPKHAASQKIFGVFPHTLRQKNVKLMKGFDDVFYVPHSRHSTVLHEDVERLGELTILSESDDSGVYIVSTKNERQIFVMGHPEYDPFSLKNEYERDVKKGLDIQIPKNYFRDDDPHNEPIVSWRSSANLLFSNWLNYYVYQETPFDLADMHKGLIKV